MKRNLIIAFLLMNSTIIFAGNEVVEGYVFDGKKGISDVTIRTSVNEKIVKTNRKGYFKVKGISTEKDTVFVEITNNDVLEIPLWGANQLTVRQMGDSVFVERGERKMVVNSSYGGTLITRDALESTGETNLLKAIALKAPGVEYVQENLLIRGIKSFNLSNNPLYILDGVETTQVSYLTVMEVESVEVLKDASTSMFGLKGGNGVIIINRNRP